MSRIMARVAVCLVLTVVFFFGLATAVRSAPSGFRKCPQPPCLAPCSPSDPADVVCKSHGQGTFQTTFACCCCGSGRNSFKPIP